MESKIYPKPRIVLSACLNLEQVRYDGGLVRDEFVLKLRDFCEVISICPEVSIGLGVPRDKIIVYKKDSEYRLSQPSTGVDLTQAMVDFSERFLSSLTEIDGFLLKSKSPSCGVSNTLVYRDSKGEKFYGRYKGIFAIKVLERFKYLPVEDEKRLKNDDIRRHFLTKLFAIADLRRLKRNIKGIRELLDFHQRYKYLLMSYNQTKLKSMGRLLASYKNKNDLSSILENYETLFLKAIEKKPKNGQHANVMLHIFGYVSDKLKSREKHYFLKLIEDYRQNKIKLDLLIMFIKNWAYRFDDEYLIGQVYLDPFPEELKV